MAAVSYLDLTSILNKVFEPDLASQINRASVLAQVLPKKPVVGDDVRWPARFGTSTATAEADGAVISTYNSDVKAPASLPVATYQDAFKLNGRAVAAAYNNGGPAGVADIAAEHVMEAGERVASKINTDLYDGTGSTSEPITIAGLTSTALLNDGGTYANVSRTTYAQWKSNVLANGGVPRALSFALMRDMRRAIYDASGRRPDLLVCDSFQHEKYGQLFDAERRYVNEIHVSGRKITLDGGYAVLEFDGIPIIEDKDCDAGTILFLNTSEVAIRLLPNAAMQLAAAVGAVDAAGSPEEQYGGGAIGIRARIQELAHDGDYIIFQVLVYLQLQVRRPNACGVLKDLATT